MTIVDQIIASLRDEPERWSDYSDKSELEMVGGARSYRIFASSQYRMHVRDENCNWRYTSPWQSFRLRQAIRNRKMRPLK